MTDVLGDTHGVDDWGSAELKLWIWIVEKDNGSVDVSEKADGSDVRSFPGVVQRSLVVRARARLKNKDDDPWQADDAFTVAPDAEEPHVIDVVRSEMAWPVRGHIEFAVRNDRAP